MKKDCSDVMEETPVYHIFQLVWDFLTTEEQVTLQSAALTPSDRPMPIAKR
jgi:hypothetical protein